jgi:hypothetical protein
MTTRTATLSKVMKAAWTIRRKDGTTMSQALVKAWAWVKRAASSTSGTYFQMCRVIAETEKAIKVAILGNAGRYNGWMPKSAIVSLGHDNITVADWFLKKF